MCARCAGRPSDLPPGRGHRRRHVEQALALSRGLSKDEGGAARICCASTTALRGKTANWASTGDVIIASQLEPICTARERSNMFYRRTEVEPHTLRAMNRCYPTLGIFVGTVAFGRTLRLQQAWPLAEAATWGAVAASGGGGLLAACLGLSAAGSAPSRRYRRHEEGGERSTYVEVKPGEAGSISRRRLPEKRLI